MDRLEAVGTKAHGLVRWRDSFIMLDSVGGALIALDAQGKPSPVWRVPETGKFLKGLAVVDDVAFFGLSQAAERSQRTDVTSNSELVAVGLANRTLLWRRTLPTHGLLNLVSAPQLGKASTYKAMYTADYVPAAVVSSGGSGKGKTLSGSGGGSDDDDAEEQDEKEEGDNAKGPDYKDGSKGSGRDEEEDEEEASDKQEGQQGKGKGAGGSGASTIIEDARPSSGADAGAGQVPGGVVLYTAAAQRVLDAAAERLQALGYPARYGGRWSTGYPYLDLGIKSGANAEGTGLQIPMFMANISALKAKLLAMPADMWAAARQAADNAVVTGRADNMAKYKPGVVSFFCVFSDQSTDKVFR